MPRVCSVTEEKKYVKINLQYDDSGSHQMLKVESSSFQMMT
jgi:hypothetical protein